MPSIPSTGAAGEFETAALVKEINQQRTVRSMRPPRPCVWPLLRGCGTLQPESLPVPFSFQARPMTHDLMKNTVEAMGYRVSSIPNGTHQPAQPAALPLVPGTARDRLSTPRP